MMYALVTTAGAVGYNLTLLPELRDGRGTVYSGLKSRGYYLAPLPGLRERWEVIEIPA